MIQWLTQLGSGSDERSEAIARQGLESLQTLSEISSSDIKAICDTARRPGGSITVGQGADARTLPNPGYAIPGLLQAKLELGVHAAKYYACVGRPIRQTNMAWGYLRHFRDLLTINANWRDPKPLPTIGRSMPIMKLLELIRGHLRRVLGVRKIPLAYVVRPNVNVDPIADAPLRVGPSTLPYAAKYLSFHEEQIIRASHSHPAFVEDNATVLDIILKTVENTSYMSSIKTAIDRRDGREALLALERHNMGNGKWDEVIKKAEKNVLVVKWKGNNQRFSLKRHITLHRDAQNDMERADNADDYEYQVPNQHTRVQRLLASLESKDPRVVSAKAHIIGDPGRYSSFELVAEYLLQVAPPEPETTNDKAHNVSGVLQGDGYRPAKIGKTGVELRYYKRKEFMKFSEAQKTELKEWRAQRENRGKKRGRDEAGESEESKKIKALTAQVSSLSGVIQDLKKATETKTVTIAESPPGQSALKNPPSRPTQRKK